MTLSTQLERLCEAVAVQINPVCSAAAREEAYQILEGFLNKSDSLFVFGEELATNGGSLPIRLFGLQCITRAITVRWHDKWHPQKPNVMVAMGTLEKLVTSVSLKDPSSVLLKISALIVEVIKREVPDRYDPSGFLDACWGYSACGKQIVMMVTRDLIREVLDPEYHDEVVIGRYKEIREATCALVGTIPNHEVAKLEDWLNGKRPDLLWRQYKALLDSAGWWKNGCDPPSQAFLTRAAELTFEAATTMAERLADSWPQVDEFTRLAFQFLFTEPAWPAGGDCTRRLATACVKFISASFRRQDFVKMPEILDDRGENVIWPKNLSLNLNDVQHRISKNMSLVPTMDRESTKELHEILSQAFSHLASQIQMKTPPRYLSQYLSVIISLASMNDERVSVFTGLVAKVLFEPGQQEGFAELGTSSTVGQQRTHSQMLSQLSRLADALFRMMFRVAGTELVHVNVEENDTDHLKAWAACQTAIPLIVTRMPEVAKAWLVGTLTGPLQGLNVIQMRLIIKVAEQIDGAQPMKDLVEHLLAMPPSPVQNLERLKLGLLVCQKSAFRGDRRLLLRAWQRFCMTAGDHLSSIFDASWLWLRSMADEFRGIYEKARKCCTDERLSWIFAFSVNVFAKDVNPDSKASAVDEGMSFLIASLRRNEQHGGSLMSIGDVTLMAQMISKMHSSLERGHLTDALRDTTAMEALKVCLPINVRLAKIPEARNACAQVLEACCRLCKPASMAASPEFALRVFEALCTDFRPAVLQVVIKKVLRPLIAHCNTEATWVVVGPIMKAFCRPMNQMLAAERQQQEELESESRRLEVKKLNDCTSSWSQALNAFISKEDATAEKVKRVRVLNYLVEQSQESDLFITCLTCLLDLCRALYVHLASPGLLYIAPLHLHNATLNEFFERHVFVLLMDIFASNVVPEDKRSQAFTLLRKILAVRATHVRLSSVFHNAAALQNRKIDLQRLIELENGLGNNTVPVRLGRSLQTILKDIEGQALSQMGNVQKSFTPTPMKPRPTSKRKDNAAGCEDFVDGILDNFFSEPAPRYMAMSTPSRPKR